MKRVKKVRKTQDAQKPVEKKNNDEVKVERKDTAEESLLALPYDVEKAEEEAKEATLAAYYARVRQQLEEGDFSTTPSSRSADAASPCSGPPGLHRAGSTSDFSDVSSLYLTVGASVCARPSATIAAIVSFCAANDEVPCARLACFVGLPVATLYVSLHMLPPQLL